MKYFAMILGFACLLTGCKTAPVHNIDNFAINATGSMSLNDIEKAIIMAGESRRWIMRPIKPGSIEGVLWLGSRMVAVNITYTDRAFSIKYAESMNMQYSSEKNTIHNKYNRLIKYLDWAIRNTLAMAAAEKQ